MDRGKFQWCGKSPTYIEHFTCEIRAMRKSLGKLNQNDSNLGVIALRNCRERASETQVDMKRFAQKLSLKTG